MELKENTKKTKWSFFEVLMIVSGVLFFAAFAVQEKDCSFPPVGIIFLTGGAISFLVSFVGVLIKKAIQEQEVEEKKSKV